MRRASWKGNAPQHNRLNTACSITNGLIVYYPCNEGGGRWPRDVMQKTYTYPPTINGTITNKGNFFESSTGDILYPANDSVNFERTDTFSVGGWINFNGASTGGQMVGHTPDGNVGWQLWPRITAPSSIKFYFMNSYSGGKYIDISWSFPFVQGVWSHIVITFTGSSLASGFSCYVNSLPLSVSGSPINNLTASSKASSDIGLFGRNGSATYLPAKLKNIYAWNRVLSQQEIQRLYQDPYCMLAPKVRHIHFDEDLLITGYNSPYFGCNF